MQNSDPYSAMNIELPTTQDIQEKLNQIKCKGSTYCIFTLQDLVVKNGGVLINKTGNCHKSILRLFRDYFQAYFQKYQNSSQQNSQENEIDLIKKFKEIFKQKTKQTQKSTLMDFVDLFKLETQDLLILKVIDGIETQEIITRVKKSKQNQIKYIAGKLFREIINEKSLDFMLKRRKISQTLAHISLAYQYTSRLANPFLIGKMEFGRINKKHQIRKYNSRKIERNNSRKIERNNSRKIERNNSRKIERTKKKLNETSFQQS